MGHITVVTSLCIVTPGVSSLLVFLLLSNKRGTTSCLVLWHEHHNQTIKAIPPLLNSENSFFAMIQAVYAIPGTSVAFSLGNKILPPTCKLKLLAHPVIDAKRMGSATNKNSGFLGGLEVDPYLASLSFLKDHWLTYLQQYWRNGRASDNPLKSPTAAASLSWGDVAGIHVTGPLFTKTISALLRFGGYKITS